MNNLPTGTVIAVLLIILLAIVLYFDRVRTKDNYEDKLNDLKEAVHDKNIIIDSLDNQNETFRKTISLYEDSISELSKYKSKIIIKYRDQKKNIDNSSINFLDSIIRANTGLK